MENFFETVSYVKARKMGPRRFVEDYLFPAMRREHGLGFAMETWGSEFNPERESVLLDGLERKIPICRTAMCIGGTMQAITSEADEELLSELLGVRYDDIGYLLFYGWDGEVGPWKGLAKKFAAARTPAAKEKIAEKAVLAAIEIGEKAKKA